MCFHRTVITLVLLVVLLAVPASAARSSILYPRSPDVFVQGPDEAQGIRSPDVTGWSDDTYDDLFIGVPWEAIGDTPAAGMVHALYSTASGPSGARAQAWDQNDDYVSDTVSAGNYFGSDFAAGDFNGDYQMDLAISVMGEDFSDPEETFLYVGAVNVLYGAANGLDAVDGQFLHTPFYGTDLPGHILMDYFGRSLAAADFNMDGYTDLAVGVPGGDISFLHMDKGLVRLYKGSVYGLLEVAGALVQGNTFVPESSDQFGYAPASGDYNGDGFPDLAVGSPGEALNPNTSSYGVIEIFYGSHKGLDPNQTPLAYSQGDFLGPYARESGDQFGSVLSSGDFDGNGVDDLAIGVPYENINNIEDAGMVHVLRFSKTGAPSVSHFEQGQSGFPDTSEQSDRLGLALTAADFNSDGYDELVIASDESDAVADQFGVVYVLRGSANGPVLTNFQTISEGYNIPSSFPEDNDHFGASLAAGYLNNDRYADLVVGVPGETVDGEARAGAVFVLFGSTTGVSIGSHQYWTQLSDGINGAPEASDQFGLAVGTSWCPMCRYPVYVPLVVR